MHHCRVWGWPRHCSPACGRSHRAGPTPPAAYSTWLCPRLAMTPLSTFCSPLSLPAWVPLLCGSHIQEEPLPPQSLCMFLHEHGAVSLPSSQSGLCSWATLSETLALAPGKAQQDHPLSGRRVWGFCTMQSHKQEGKARQTLAELHARGTVEGGGNLTLFCPLFA